MKLRERLARWLLSAIPKEPAKPYLDCLIPSPNGPVLTTYLITGTNGISLVAHPVSGAGQGVRILTEFDAVDKQLYWELWKQFSPAGSKLTWEDGTEFRPADVGSKPL